MLFLASLQAGVVTVARELIYAGSTAANFSFRSLLLDGAHSFMKTSKEIREEIEDVKYERERCESLRKSWPMRRGLPSTACLTTNLPRQERDTASLITHAAAAYHSSKDNFVPHRN
jgi:hypothetical protein